MDPRVPTRPAGSGSDRVRGVAGPPGRRLRRLLAASALLAAAIGALGAGGVRAHAAAACSPGDLDCLDPATYDLGQAIVTHVQVPVGTTQLDPTGTQNDFIWVDYIR